MDSDSRDHFKDAEQSRNKCCEPKLKWEQSWDEDAEATEAEQQRAVWVTFKVSSGPGATGSIREDQVWGLCWGSFCRGMERTTKEKMLREHKGDSLEQTDSHRTGASRGTTYAP